MNRPIDRPGPRPGDTVLSLSTPLPLIDEDRLAANIGRVQTYMDAHGLAFRPHIKTHKIPALARQQQEAGATGINCQKITEAEVFADAGFEDILITFNILGPEKLVRLAALNERISGLKVVADSIVTVEGLSSYFGDRKPLNVLVECDTGAGRCGVQTPADAVALAQAIFASTTLRFGGVMTYPKAHTELAVESFLLKSLPALPLSAFPVRLSRTAEHQACFPPIWYHRPPSIGPEPISIATGAWQRQDTARLPIAPCISSRRSCRAPRRTAPFWMLAPKR